MTSIQTILHPTDFSRCAQKAFEAACALARGSGAQVIVLHVVEPVRLPATRRSIGLFSRPKVERWEALSRLRVREPGIWIEPVMRKGIPAEVILEFAREIPCEVIVMGMQGRARDGLSSLGSVAAEVAKRATCPVVNVKLPRTAAQCPNKGNLNPGSIWRGQAAFGWKQYEERVR